MKVIFLDIDGVLNSITSAIIFKNAYYEDGIDKTAFGLLKFLCEKTKAQIVISSSWRYGKTPEYFKGLFEAHGWRRPPIIGCTPILQGMRGDEVDAWIKDQSECIDKYVCIDDDTHFYEDQNLINTSCLYGLQIHHVIQAYDILNDGFEKEKQIEELRKHVNFIKRHKRYKIYKRK